MTAPSSAPSASHRPSRARPERLPAGDGRRPPRPSFRFPILGLARGWRTAACALAAAFFLLPGAENAQAQSATTLVSNLGQKIISGSNFSLHDSAQSFGTGGSADGYTLTSVDVNFSAAPGSDLRVRLVQGFDLTGTTFATLTNPPSLAAGTLTFTAPAGTTLAAGTTYTIVLDSTTTGRVTLTNSNAEDSGRAAGWQINNASSQTGFIGSGEKTDTWLTINRMLRIRVNGYAIAPKFSSAVLTDDDKVTVNFDKPLMSGSCASLNFHGTEIG